MRAIRSAIGAAVLVALAFASHGAFGPRYGGRLNVGVLDLDGDASPAFTRNRGTRLLTGLRHETLVTLDANGNLLPSLAQRWSPAAGGREWTFQLPEGARFHNDTPLAAEDAARSVRRFLRSASPAGAFLAARLEGGSAYRRAASETLSGVSTSTANRLVLRFTSEQAGPPAELAALAAGVTGADGAACGPYLLAHVARGERAALVAFDHHVRGRPFLDDIEVVRFPDRAALRLALEHGSVHVALGDPGATRRVARLLLLLDTGGAAFDTLAARRRVAQAVDRDLFVRRFMPEAEALCRLLPNPATACEPATRSESAKRPDVPIRLNVDATVSPLVSQRVVAQLVALGYRVNVAVLAPDAVVSTPADARLLLWCPEVDEPLLTLHELALLAGVLRPQTMAALTGEAARAARRAVIDEQERALLSTCALIPLTLAPLVAIGPAPVGVDVTGSGQLRVEDAWLPL